MVESMLEGGGEAKSESNPTSDNNSHTIRQPGSLLGRGDSNNATSHTTAASGATAVTVSRAIILNNNSSSSHNNNRQRPSVLSSHGRRRSSTRRHGLELDLDMSVHSLDNYGGTSGGGSVVGGGNGGNNTGITLKDIKTSVQAAIQSDKEEALKQLRCIETKDSAEKANRQARRWKCLADTKHSALSTSARSMQSTQSATSAQSLPSARSLRFKNGAVQRPTEAGGCAPRTPSTSRRKLSFSGVVVPKSPARLNQHLRRQAARRRNSGQQDDAASVASAGSASMRSNRSTGSLRVPRRPRSPAALGLSGAAVVAAAAASPYSKSPRHKARRRSFQVPATLQDEQKSMSFQVIAASCCAPNLVALDYVPNHLAVPDLAVLSVARRRASTGKMKRSSAAAMAGGMPTTTKPKATHHPLRRATRRMTLNSKSSTPTTSSSPAPSTPSALQEKCSLLFQQDNNVVADLRRASSKSTSHIVSDMEAGDNLDIWNPYARTRRTTSSGVDKKSKYKSLLAANNKKNDKVDSSSSSSNTNKSQRQKHDSGGKSTTNSNDMRKAARDRCRKEAKKLLASSSAILTSPSHNKSSRSKIAAFTPKHQPPAPKHTGTVGDQDVTSLPPQLSNTNNPHGNHNTVAANDSSDDEDLYLEDINNVDSTTKRIEAVSSDASSNAAAVETRSVVTCDNDDVSSVRMDTKHIHANDGNLSTTNGSGRLMTGEHEAETHLVRSGHVISDTEEGSGIDAIQTENMCSAISKVPTEEDVNDIAGVNNIATESLDTVTMSNGRENQMAQVKTNTSGAIDNRGDLTFDAEKVNQGTDVRGEMEEQFTSEAVLLATGEPAADAAFATKKTEDVSATACSSHLTAEERSAKGHTNNFQLSHNGRISDPTNAISDDSATGNQTARGRREEEITSVVAPVRAGSTVERSAAEFARIPESPDASAAVVIVPLVCAAAVSATEELESTETPEEQWNAGIHDITNGALVAEVESQVVAVEDYVPPAQSATVINSKSNDQALLVSAPASRDAFDSTPASEEPTTNTPEMPAVEHIICGDLDLGVPPSDQPLLNGDTVGGSIFEAPGGMFAATGRDGAVSNGSEMKMAAGNMFSSVAEVSGIPSIPPPPGTEVDFPGTPKRSNVSSKGMEVGMIRIAIRGGELARVTDSTERLRKKKKSRPRSSRASRSHRSSDGRQSESRKKKRMKKPEKRSFLEEVEALMMAKNYKKAGDRLPTISEKRRRSGRSGRSERTNPSSSTSIMSSSTHAKEHRSARRRSSSAASVSSKARKMRNSPTRKRRPSLSTPRSRSMHAREPGLSGPKGKSEAETMTSEVASLRETAAPLAGNTQSSLLDIPSDTVNAFESPNHVHGGANPQTPSHSQSSHQSVASLE